LFLCLYFSQHHCHKFVATIDNLTRVNSTPYNNIGCDKGRGGGSTSQQCNWSQEEMDAMENSTYNSSNILRTRGKGKGKGSRGPSHQHHKLE
jgi:hypothetical protein